MTIPLGPSRARNSRPLPDLGDPERWGGFTSLPLLLRNTGTPINADGQQLIRVQVPDLMARSWDISGTFSITGLAPLDVILALQIQVTWGVGQNSQTAMFDLSSTRYPWVGQFNQLTKNGVVQSGWQFNTPLPAVAMAISPYVSASTTELVDHVVTFTFSAAVSPRALQ